MSLDLVIVPCLEDNYAFLIHDSDTGSTALFDAPDDRPITLALEKRGWNLTEIFLTHHHADHIDGVAVLREQFNPRVIGAARDAQRLPRLDVEVMPGDVVSFSGHDVTVIDAAGHTSGHIAFNMPDAGCAFTGDSLMALGCGRLFEGSAQDMWGTLQRLAALPDDTLICSGHEYTTANAKFAQSIEPDNPWLKERMADISEAREKGRPTVPSMLDMEKATNPFLRANLPEVKALLGMAEADDVTVFAEIRARKDNF
ncbi:MAG: hydroxyacylglutathione hydrolase [Maritimibacter sp.]